MKTIKIESIGHEPIVLNVPEGAKVSIEDGLTIIEPEFKKGDILVYTYSTLKPSVFIYNNESESFCCLDLQDITIPVSYNVDFSADLRIRHATEAEKQILFDALAKSGKAWDAEKKEIVNLKYVPKGGDCVKLELIDNYKVIYLEITHESDDYVNSKTHISNGKLHVDNSYNNEGGWFKNSTYRKYTKITPEELQAEFNKLGYEYNFETHTAKKLRWKPEEGEPYFFVNMYGDICEYEWEGNTTDYEFYNFGNCHRTISDARNYKNYILKYHEQNN